MRRSVYLVLFSFLLLANRCPPEGGLSVYEGALFKVKNTSSNAILVLSAAEIAEYKKGHLSPESIAERFVSAYGVKEIFFTGEELVSFSKNGHYILTVVEEEYGKEGRKVRLKEFRIGKDQLLNSHNNLIIYKENKEIEVVLEK